MKPKDKITKDAYAKRFYLALTLCKSESDYYKIINKIYEDGFSDGNDSCAEEEGYKVSKPKRYRKSGWHE
jgi:hypothetical protein